MGQPNVLFLMSDEHNHRHLGYRGVGEGSVNTPTLDDLMQRGARFEQTYCSVPICAPSRRCILTGKEQQNCGAWENGSLWDDEGTTLAEAFSRAGYETCLVGKMHFNGRRQFHGFDNRPYGDLIGHDIQQPGHQPDPIDPDRLDVQPRRQAIEKGTRIPGAGVTEIPESLLQEQVVARESISWLREHRHASPDRPWFLCASFSRPHFPLTAPRRHFERYWPDGVSGPEVGEDSDAAQHPYARHKAESNGTADLDEETVLRARAAYLACIDFLDEVLGEFLRTLDDAGLLENTVIVYTSDHGELAGEHGLWWKDAWHEASARVPWSVQLPAHREGTRDPAEISTPVSLIDLFPTLCGIAGIEAPDDLDGTDLSEPVETGAEPNRGPVFTDFLAHSTDRFAYRMVRDGRYKYVGFRDAPGVLFDVEADPYERDNLAIDPDEEHAAVLERLRAIVDDTVDFGAVDEQRRRDERESAGQALGIPRGTGNAYLLPDGRLVDAATPLYKPDVLAHEPSRVFTDWPDAGPDA
jgi:choline-sulfatase